MPPYKQRINADRLSRARARAGLRQEDLAAAAAINKRSVGLLEGGQRNASPGVVTRLANALGVSPGYLYGDGDDDWPPIPLGDDRAHT